MKRITVMTAALLILLALALSPDLPALQAARSTPTPQPEVEVTATPAPGAAPAAAVEVTGQEQEPTVADLLVRLESLEATVAELVADHQAAHAVSYDQANAVNVAIYLLDSAGIHQLETRLGQDGEILPGDSGRMAHLARLLSTVEWPDPLAAEAVTLQEKLTTLAAALGDDNLEAVKPLSSDTHVAYHLFSHNARMWLADHVAGQLSAAPGQANRVNTAVYLLDDAGLHDLAQRLLDDGQIQPGDSGPVVHVARLLTTVDWPDALAADAAALHETLTSLASALADDDLKAATNLADQAHEAQHDFSHRAQEWLSMQASDGGMDHHDTTPTDHTHSGG